MTISRRRFLQVGAGAAGLVSGSGTVRAQAWPTRPVVPVETANESSGTVGAPIARSITVAGTECGRVG